MIVYDPYNPANEIADPAFITARWGDDTPTIYAVPAADADRWLAAWNSRSDCTANLLPAADAKAHSDARGFVGILISRQTPFAAWGNCHFR